MACLGAVLYDPATQQSKATSAALAMTAFDTTNARITFTAPSNGIVLCRVRCAQTGAATEPSILFGVLDGSTVRGRSAPMSGRQNGTTMRRGREAVFLVNGLTGGNSYTFDAAYGVELAVASSVLVYGGPNNSTAGDAAGALAFEVWETPNLLAGKLYDPGTAAGPALTPSVAMTAIDTTNLRLTFTCPASGMVLVRLRCVASGATSQPNFLLGVLDGSTVRMRQAPVGGNVNTGAQVATDQQVFEAQAVIPGLTPSNSYTFDAAYGVEATVASMTMRYGGPNDTTATNAYGGFAYEIWEA